MDRTINNLAKTLTKSPKAIAITAVALVLVLWIAGNLVWSLVTTLAFVATVLLTAWVLGPDLHAFFRKQNRQVPWLARLRQHRWLPVRLPWVGLLPRGYAYLGLLFAWLLVLN